MTNFTTKQRACMAAVMGISNMGMDNMLVRADAKPQTGYQHGVTTPDDLVGYLSQLNGRFVTVSNAVYHIGNPFLESDSMADMFVEEALSWDKKLANMTVEKVKQTWPYYANYVDALIAVPV